MAAPTVVSGNKQPIARRIPAIKVLREALVITHEAAAGRVAAALDNIARLDEVHGEPQLLGVVSERGVS